MKSSRRKWRCWRCFAGASALRGVFSSAYPSALKHASSVRASVATFWSHTDEELVMRIRSQNARSLSSASVPGSGGSSPSF